MGCIDPNQDGYDTTCSLTASLSRTFAAPGSKRHDNWCGLA